MTTPSGAYYNEHNPKAAAWLRELIKAGLIAPGDVDERSIEDVLPTELAGYTQCHFFAGIGVWSYALRRTGWPDDRPVWTGSCPCQPFSAAGKGDGFADERHLWPAFYHLIGQRRPDIVLGEQVASKDADTWIDLVHTDMEALGYAFGAVPFPSAGVGAPNIRDRLYWVADSDCAGQCARSEGLATVGYRTSVESDRSFIGLADAMSTGRSERGAESRGGSASGRSVVGRLVHPLIEGLEGQPRNGNHRDEPGRIGAEPSGSTAEDGGARGMADAEELRRAGQPLRTGSGLQTDGIAQDCDACQPGPTNGFWRAADWLGCRDGKWRPVEPGTFPLAHGAAARVGRLLGYGNAINAEAAIAFIEAFALRT